VPTHASYLLLPTSYSYSCAYSYSYPNRSANAESKSKSRRKRENREKVPPLILNAHPNSSVNSSVPKLFTNLGDALLSHGVTSNPGANLRGAVSTPSRGRAVALLCLGLSVGVAVDLTGGEKIDVSTAPTEANLPKAPTKEIILPNSFMNSRISGGESGRGPVVPAPGQQPPALIRDPKLDEWLDRKKNWMLDSPNTLDRDRTLEQIFGVRRYELNNFDRKTKSTMDRFIDSDRESGSKDPSRGFQDVRESSGKDSLTSDRELDSQRRYSSSSSKQDVSEVESGGIMPELNPALLFTWSPMPDASTSVTGTLDRRSILPRSLTDSLIGTRSVGQPNSAIRPNAPVQEIERFLERKAPMSGIRDPIRDLADTTRTPIQPISARKASVPPPDIGQSRATEGAAAFGSITPPAPRSSDLLNMGRDRGDFGPGMGPRSPAAAPASAALPQPKPAVLEIPRPKF
jgi:hypothetical protein